MKKKFIPMLAFVLLLLKHYSLAQDSSMAGIKEPDFPFEPAYLDSSLNQTLLPLEQYETTSKSKIGKATILYVIKTPESTLIIRQQETIEMVVKQGLINGTMTNVKDIYKLFKMDADSKKRTCSIMSAKGISNLTSTVDPGLPISYKKVKGDIFLLQFKNLEPGEYVIEVSVRSPKLYSFSIK